MANHWAPTHTGDGPKLHHTETTVNSDHIGVETTREGTHGALYQQVLRSEKLLGSLYQEIAMLEEALGAILLPEYQISGVQDEQNAKAPSDRMSELQASMRRLNTSIELVASRLEVLRGRVDL